MLEIIRINKDLVNSIWFFGDSFTAGHGCRATFKYCQEYGPGKTFTELLSEYYSLKERNYGADGISNPTILSTFISEIPNMSPGDRVVIGNTSPLRDLVPNKQGTALIDQKLFDSTPYPTSLAHQDDKLEVILREYCIEFKSNYVQLWSNYYNRQFLKLFKFLEKIDIKCILWDYSVWSEEISPGMKFENILTHTNGNIYDLHWSFNGHNEAYKWIRDSFNVKKRYIKK